jgi:hypothetical protein
MNTHCAAAPWIYFYVYLDVLSIPLLTDIIAFCWFENSARSLLAVPDFIACIRYFASVIFITQAYSGTKSKDVDIF